MSRSQPDCAVPSDLRRFDQSRFFRKPVAGCGIPGSSYLEELKMPAGMSGALPASRLLALPLFHFTASPLKVLLVLERLAGFLHLLFTGVEATLSRRHRLDRFDWCELQEPHARI